LPGWGGGGEKRAILYTQSKTREKGDTQSGGDREQLKRKDRRIRHVQAKLWDTILPRKWGKIRKKKSPKAAATFVGGGEEKKKQPNGVEEKGNTILKGGGTLQDCEEKKVNMMPYRCEQSRSETGEKEGGAKEELGRSKKNGGVSPLCEGVQRPSLENANNKGARDTTEGRDLKISST